MADLVQSYRLQVDHRSAHERESMFQFLAPSKVESTVRRGGVGEHHQYAVKTKKKDKVEMNQEERLVLKVRISFPKKCQPDYTYHITLYSTSYNLSVCFSVRTCRMTINSCQGQY